MLTAMEFLCFPVAFPKKPLGGQRKLTDEEEQQIRALKAPKSHKFAWAEREADRFRICVTHFYRIRAGK